VVQQKATERYAPSEQFVSARIRTDLVPEQFFGEQKRGFEQVLSELSGLRSLSILCNDPSEPPQLLKIHFIILKTFSHVPGARASSRHPPLARLGNGDPLAKERSNGRAGTYPAQPSPFATAALAYKPV